MLISIVVPIHNKEKEIEKCVNSIINQTFANLEIFLVNDGSTDNTQVICEKLQARDKRIKLITQKNGGVSVARNTGLERAKGDYTMFVDPDDWLSLEIVERLFKVTSKSQYDIVSCCANVHDNGKEIKNSFFRIKKGEVKKERAIAQLFSDDYYKDAGVYIDNGVVWAKLYKTSFLHHNQITFNPRLRRMQDNIFNLYAIEKAEKFYYIDEPLYNYDFEHIGGTSRKYIHDAEEIFINNTVEKIKFYKRYYPNTALLRVLLYKNLSHFLLNILANNTCHPKSNGNISQRVNKMKYLCEESPLKLLFETKELYLENKLKNILIKLLSKRNYKTIYFLFRIGYVIGM